MFRRPTAALAALAALTSSLTVSAARAADAPTFSGKAHVLFIPNEGQKGLSFGDRSKADGLAVSTQGADAKGNLSVNLSGKTEKGRSFPQTFNLNNLTMDEVIPEIGGASFVPPACLGVDGVCSDDRQLISSDKAGSSVLNYSSYGIAGRGANDARGVRNNWYGAGYFGTQTAIGQMNTLKTSKIKATYEGNFLGILIHNYADDNNGLTVHNTEGELLTGKTKIQADFKNGNVTGRIDGLLIGEPGSEDQDTIDQGIGIKAKIKGSAYSGNASIIKGSGAVKGGGSVSKSAVNGGFFGPNAAETAGSLRLEGKITPTRNGAAMTQGDTGKALKNVPIGIVGSFGAVKK